MSPRDLLHPETGVSRDIPLVDINVLTGNCSNVLKGLAADRYDCCVTSPPYYFVRDYGHDEQLGLEASPIEYVDRMVDVFEEVKRVLKPTGTLWCNLGDNYCTRRAIREDGKRTVSKGGKLPSWAEKARAGRTITGAQFRNLNIKEKDLFLMPHLLAGALRDCGWYLRAVIHWFKTSVVPERSRDAPTDCVEYVFLFSKQDTGYIYHGDVLREKGSDEGEAGDGRPHRNVWEIRQSTFRSEHTATMPEELARRCILTGSDVGGWVLDPFAGTGTTGVVAKMYGRNADLIELNPDFVEIAKMRLQTTKPAKRRDDGIDDSHL